MDPISDADLVALIKETTPAFQEMFRGRKYLIIVLPGEPGQKFCFAGTSEHHVIAECMRRLVAMQRPAGTDPSQN